MAVVSRLAVRVTRDAARQIQGGHPWIFDRSIVSVRPGGSAGDLAVVFDDQRRFMAIGLYDPASPIRIKVLHAGSPTPVDDSFWLGRLGDASALRSGLRADASTTAFRWVHGENDRLPGLVLDRYDDTTVLKAYSAAWAPHLDAVVAAAQQVMPSERVVMRLARNVAREVGGTEAATALVGDLPPGPVGFVENGLRFEADLVRGQKTGHFLDQRDNRLRVRALSARTRVLDVYSCTGGFSVNAAAGGAVSVHSVDASPGAIATARSNMALNQALATVRSCRHDQTVGDAMRTMQAMAARGQRFDLVVVDPPSFASRKDQVGAALRAYGRLTDLALDLLEPGGTLVQASCSARVTAHEFFDVVETTARRRGVMLVQETRTAHAVDHPVGFPEGAYLKSVFATVARR